MVSSPHRIRRLYVVVAVATLALFLLLRLWTSIRASGPEARARQLMPAIGAEVVDRPLSRDLATFQLETPPGRSRESVRLGDFPDDAVVVLNFWATWCRPCIQELPSLLELSQEIRDRRFIMLAVSYDESWEGIRRFFREAVGRMPRRLRLARDPQARGGEGRTLRAAFGTQKLPETWVIRDGRVLARFVNARDWAQPSMIEYFRRLLESG